MKTFFKRIFFLLISLYLIICTALYFFQEKILFHPRKINSEYTFTYPNAQEIWIPVENNTKLHGLWFKKPKSKGVILYLHGNGGTMRQVGYLGNHYNQYGYDFLAYDYRGYGKSEGKITSETQFYNDAQVVFDYVKKQYPDSKIVVIGYSIGTATAAKLTADNSINQLVLFAPYFSIENMKNERYLNFIPSFLLRYPFNTHENLKRVEEPITVFHGKNDRVISFSNASKLQNRIPDLDLYLLENQGHGGIFFHKKVEEVLKEKF